MGSELGFEASSLAILVIEDEALVGRSLCRILDELGADAVLAPTVDSARARLHERSWQGVILDIALPDGCGLDLLEQLRLAHPHVPVLVQTGLDDPSLPNRAFLLDATVVRKPLDRSHLEKFCRNAKARQTRCERKLAESILAFGRTFGLSEAEACVLRGAMEGKSYKEIAAARGTSTNTIKTQVSSILSKTGCRSLPEAVSVALAGVLAD